MATRTGYRHNTSYSSRSSYTQESYGQSRYTQNRTTSNRSGYVYGNVAHQLEEVPERKQRPERRKHTKVYPRQRPVDMPSISAGSFVFLVAAAVVVMVFCFQFLRVQSGITQMQNEAVALQNEIAETKIENEEAFRRISDSVDLSQVYETATKELGMTQAVDNQVYTYDNKKSDMVKQHGDIPEASK